ncbi:S9 family peptidase [Corallococcus sp. H22C18031201]|uniref:S9 family peptidase n=1 Tax=Citreicoccus inhibens TaxID=2849499 RepID=UPI000E711F7D|nr:S9 family peptidase [Citreicoccus inhibens]MBU8895435.1 S9 family peptidase [Citreicoccus inhibens]RJS22529.1 S9 family peptidase [Corallococcus sp. H22C18031201]
MTVWNASCRALALVTLLPLAAVALPAPTAPPRPSKQYTIEQFMGTTGLAGMDFTADQKHLLYSSNQTGIFNIFRVPVGGGAPAQLTHSTTDSTFLVSAFPRDERLLFQRDQGGNEQVHLYVRTPDGKERDLTPGSKLRASFLGWSRDDSAFYALTNERDARFMDLYRYDAKTYARTQLFQNDAGYDVAGVAPDEKSLALLKPRTTSDSDLWRYDLATRALKLLTPHQGDAQFSVADFDPLSGALYVLTNVDSEFTRVMRYVDATGTLEEVEKTDWDIVSSTFSRSGAYRITVINEDGRATVRLHDVKKGTELPLPTLPEGDVVAVQFSRDEQRLSLLHNGDRSPTNLYAYVLATKKATRLTNTLSPTVDPEDLVEAQRVRFKSFDGVEIPNILYKPHQASPDNKVPALVWVHGGPGGQTRKGYAAFMQYLANHGYVVLGINNRGSSGYGKSFFRADDQKHGREPLRDCVEARKYLASLPYVDATRVGIIGGSYGGYMTLAALAFHPDAFNVGVDIFGVANWLRTLKNMPPYWESRRQALYQEMGDPTTQEQMLRDISPLFHAEQIRKPLLVIQGANDPRVLRVESDEMVQAVRKNNVPVEYVVFPDEGHGFKKKKNELEAYSRTLGFLEQYLKQPASAAVTN